MIFHLQSAGVPISWTIVAIYKSSFGIAAHAAKSWQERETADRAADIARKPKRYAYIADEPATPHFIVEIKNGKVEHQELLMDERHLRQQKPGSNWLVQEKSAPVELDLETAKALTDALNTALTDFGYFIPRDEWERRYPAQKLIQDHYRAFSEAHNAHMDLKKTDPDAEFAFELRWASYMEAPDGFNFPYDVAQKWDGRTQSHTDWMVTKDRFPLEELKPTSEEQAETMMRLLNSGYRLEDIPILLAEEPVS